jgi:hypothetical protein
MKKKNSTTKEKTIVKKKTVKIESPKVAEKKVESGVIQSLLGDIAFAVNGVTHSSIITALTKCHKEILNIKKDVGIGN